MGASCGDGGCRQAGGWHTRIPRASWQLPALQSGDLSLPGAGTCTPGCHPCGSPTPRGHRAFTPQLTQTGDPIWDPKTPTIACFHISPRPAPGVQDSSTTGVFRDISQTSSGVQPILRSHSPPRPLTPSQPLRVSPPHPWGPQQRPEQPLPQAGGADLLLLIPAVLGVFDQLDLKELQRSEPLPGQGAH